MHQSNSINMITDNYIHKCMSTNIQNWLQLFSFHSRNKISECGFSLMQIILMKQVHIYIIFLKAKSSMYNIS